MCRRAAHIALVALLGTLVMSGCASTSARETCKEYEAEHKPQKCSALQWHEENEGPSVYNHFHSSYVESAGEKEAREIEAGETKERMAKQLRHWQREN